METQYITVQRPDARFTLPAVAICALLTAACGSDYSSTSAGQDESQDESSRFANVAERAQFIGDAACFDCHEAEYRGYQDHGMAQSFYPLTQENAVEDYEDVSVHHEESNLTYRVFEEGGRFFQEEVRYDQSGGIIHRLRREMEFVIGSGSAARSYVTEENGRYYELPLTWYTQEARWDFSPGYERVNVRFDRLIPDRCMTCHNSYPDPVPFVEGKYADVPHGIGCERCHGPGSIHVNARLVAPESAGAADTTIVNPARLSFDRRLDVCQQCHLHTTVSILREGRTAYDFRPSQSLQEYVALYAVDQPADNDEIDVISHADRMKQSGCFIRTRGTADAMDCLTCHNPHEGFRQAGPEYFNRTCRSCHDVAGLAERLVTPDHRGIHTENANCIDCHMPKVRAEGTPHASFTDHWIRVVDDTLVPSSDAVTSSTPRTAELNAYYEEDEAVDVYRGMAYVIYGRQRGDTVAVRNGVRLLERALESEKRVGEADYLLGFARWQLGELEQAIVALERAISNNPDIPERLNTLAQAYEAAGRSSAEIEELYLRALRLQPALARVRVNYGRFLETQNRLEEAIEEYRQALEEEPWLEEASYNLGTAYLRTGRLGPAETMLENAVRLDPDYIEALGNLGLLLASSGRENEARRYFEQAVEADPVHPVALGNLGTFHLNTGSLDQAVALLERSIQSDPRYVDGLVNLAIAYFHQGRPDLARAYAEDALRIAPENRRAREILNAL